MLELNKVLLVGNLTRDPELSYVSTGTALCKIGVACNRRWKDRNSGQQQEETTFVDVEAWSGTAEFVSKYFQKGKPIFIEGRLRFHSWDAPDGSKRSKLSVTAERVQFADTRGGGDGGKPSGGGYQQQQESQPSRPAPQPQQPSASAPQEPSQPQNTDDDLPF